MVAQNVHCSFAEQSHTRFFLVVTTAQGIKRMDKRKQRTH